MRLLGAFARAALLAYPADFRARFGKQILADLDDDPVHAPAQLSDLLKGAIAMRLDAFARDLSYAVRRLRAAPLFVAIVIFTFALGIGANVAVFSVLNAIVLRPLPFAHASSLVIVEYHGGGVTYPAISLTDAADLRSRSHALAALAAVGEDQATLLLGGRPYTLNGLDVTPDYFSVLGFAPKLGRAFAPADGEPGARNIVISYELWRQRFGADPRAVGRTISLGGRRRHIVGVLAAHQLLVHPNPGLLAEADYLAATSPRGAAGERGNRTAGAVGQLAPGTTLDQANAEFFLISRRLQQLYPHWDTKTTFSLVSLTSLVLGAASSQLWILFAAVVGVLVIACVNVGNLLAARWSSRDRELAVRRALGASSQNLAGQLLVETGLLAALGAALGVALAYGTLRAMTPLLPSDLPRASSIAIDGTSLLYAVGIVVTATLLAGLAPLLSLRAGDLQPVLKSAGRGGDASRGNRLRSALVVVEIALALALVVTSGLMVRSFSALVHTPLGIRPEGVVVSDDATLGPDTPFTTPTVSNGQRAEFVPERELLRRLRALPGVKIAALAMSYPLGDVAMEGNTPIVGRSYPPGGEPLTRANAITPDYFRALGMSLVRGRGVTNADTATSQRVVIVNQMFVDKYLSGTAPIGTQLTVPPLHSPVTIVGVVSNERFALTNPTEPEFYQPLEQAGFPYGGAVVYAPGVAPATIGREIQTAFAREMPLAQPPDTYTMAQRLASATAQARFTTILLGALAVIALLLALAGIFGVVSFSVTQRSREFGVRIALGATASAVVADVLRRALLTTAAGIAGGIALAAFAAHAIASQLKAVSPFDPLTFSAVVVLIAGCSLLASLQPACRAMRVEPAEALRYE
jgi:putative ABC transport system permease protein